MAAPRKVVVIGAGIVGAMTAVQALRRGLDVTIVEPGPPGGRQAASHGNAAWLSSHSVLPPSEPGVWRKVPGYLADPLGPLAIRPAHLLPALPWLVRYALSGWTEARVARTAAALRTLLSDAVPLHAAVAAEAGLGHLVAEGGLLHVYRDRAGFEREARGWRLRADLGIGTVELDAAALHAREPALDPAYRFGVLVPEAGHCRNPGAYVAGLVAHAQRQGARLEAVQAQGFVVENGRLRAVSTAGGEIDCDRAVLCAGIRSARLARRLGDRIPLESEGGYHVRVETAAGGPATPMMVADRKVVVSTLETGICIAGQVEIAGVDAAPDWRRAGILRRHLAELFPALAGLVEGERASVWHGHRPSTPDALPCIGRARATGDVVYAFGHGHVGLGSSARTGRLAAQLLADEAPEIDLAPFDPRRFRGG